MIKEVECTYPPCRFWREGKICTRDELKIGKSSLPLDMVICQSMERR